MSERRSARHLTLRKLGKSAGNGQAVQSVLQAQNSARTHEQLCVMLNKRKAYPIVPLAGLPGPGRQGCWRAPPGIRGERADSQRIKEAEEEDKQEQLCWRGFRG